MENDPSYQTLIDMGISTVMAEASIKKTGSNDISNLLDWISSHQNEEPQLAEWLKSVPPAAQNVPQQGISHLVNAGFNAQIQSLGHSVNVSQKALLLNDNNKQKALKWIDDHKFDADFEQPLVLVQQQQSTLTKQEAEAKLQQLIRKAREKRQKEQAEQALQRQKNRMRSGKQALEVKRITEEQRMKQQVELDKIQKEKDNNYRKQLLIQMQKQRCQKLGIPYVPKEELEAKKQKPKLSKSEAVYVQLQQVRVGNYAYPQKAKTLYDTVTIYLNNIIKDPSEQKFRRINTEGSAFQNRIAAAFGGKELLQSIGFVMDGTFLVLQNPDVEQLKEIVKALQKLSSQY